MCPARLLSPTHTLPSPGCVQGCRQGQRAAAGGGGGVWAGSGRGGGAGGAGRCPGWVLWVPRVLGSCGRLWKLVQHEAAAGPSCAKWCNAVKPASLLPPFLCASLQVAGAARAQLLVHVREAANTGLSRVKDRCVRVDEGAVLFGGGWGWFICVCSRGGPCLPTTCLLPSVLLPRQCSERHTDHPSLATAKFI